MRFYEFEAKQVLAKHGIPIPKSGTAKTAAEAEKVASELGCPVVLKAQIISPKAIKASATKSAASPAEAKKAAEALLKIDDGGRQPKGILIEKRATPAKVVLASASPTTASPSGRC